MPGAQATSLSNMRVCPPRGRPLDLLTHGPVAQAKGGLQAMFQYSPDAAIRATKALDYIAARAAPFTARGLEPVRRR